MEIKNITKYKINKSRNSGINKKLIGKNRRNKFLFINNNGSATIEITLLSLLIFGILYLYIMYLLFSIGLAKNMYEETEKLYKQNNKNQITITVHENQVPYQIFQTDNFQIRIEMKKEEDDSVTFIRRWQLANTTIS